MARNQLADRHSLQRGFTLIEILVTVSLTVLISIAAAGLFFTTLIGNTKQEILTTVKNEGDFAISQLEFLLRNAISLEVDPDAPANPVTCASDMDRITFKSIDEGTTTLATDQLKIASISGAVAPRNTVYLTTDNVILRDLKFHCAQTTTKVGTYVTITFQLEKESPDYNRPTPVIEDFTTSVNIRNL